MIPANPSPSAPDSPIDKAQAAAREHRRWCGEDPPWIATVPGRVNLIGEHVDYCGGMVLPMAINRHLTITANPNRGRAIRIHSSTLGQEVSFPVSEDLAPHPGGWANYAAGVVHGFKARGAVLRGLDIRIQSDLPAGGGLSSSAALTVALATVMEAVTETPLAPREKALLCLQAEQDFAGLPCGIMDQLTAICGLPDHLLLIDCHSLHITPIPFSSSNVAILVLNTGVRHELCTSEYRTRRAECDEAARRLGLECLAMAQLEVLGNESPDWPIPLARRARHVITEIARTRETATAIQAGDWIRAGETLYQSHVSLRDDFEVSCRELDLTVEIAAGIGLDRGMFGCRMTGGGFGGCCVALIDSRRTHDIAVSMEYGYRRATGLQPEIFVTPPTGGAKLFRASDLRGQ